jgi:hypothetical protein
MASSASPLAVAAASKAFRGKTSAGRYGTQSRQRAADAGTGGYVAGVAEHRQNVLQDALGDGVHARSGTVVVPFHPQALDETRDLTRRESCDANG